MNRASLLHILDNVTGITEAEVRELEQLATAFPYCQTAHLLLAKAAHDRGSMLAGQRLRRAATYAADRELLRLLIETPAATALAPSAPVPQASGLAAAPIDNQEVEAAAFEDSADSQLASFEDVSVGVRQEAPEAALQQITDVEAAPTEPLGSANELVAEERTEVQTGGASLNEAALGAPAELTTEEPTSTSEEAQPAEEAVVIDQATDTSIEEPSVTAELFDQPAEPEPEPAAVAEAVEASQPEVEPATAAETTGHEAPEPDSDQANAIAEAQPVPDELPAVAPPIRPPVEAGSSRFEFGLAEAAKQSPLYQLPGVDEEDEPKAAPIPPFRADEHLGYAVAGGSRFGYALALHDAELTHDLPLSDNWHPDALYLAHLSAHRPSVAALPSSLVLIERFLRSQPRIKTATARPALSEEPQADLSVRSTSAPPSLASESLAKIMVKQGKIARAIEIYEQLMQRQPEKKAYFAAQIDLLNQQTE
ncbi:hypothetical protein [Hymenobacter latericus]|uniref:hypothetical protein n=1 Tax=Hymenobacter sp. YIM 151858-1 TaxID=2987688 RepID=UPI0022271830|nr:hypothetical protein [Hymenobacter sp. YIM 151858-1]UYZ59963.1 hypothetical protein OIS50_04000 [Hymenobacter sp. YIM 151858-1]